MKDKYTVVIIDDEYTAINNLRRSLSLIDRLVLTGIAMNGNEGKELIIKSKPDVVFLDMEMPDISGLTLLRDLKNIINWPIEVIFYTAYDKFLLDALRESAFDYLLKPYEENDFVDIINRFLLCMDSDKKADYQGQSFQELLKESSTRFLVPTIKGYRSLIITEIGFFEYQKSGRHWCAILDKERVPLKRNTSATSILQLSDCFKQISQSHIINISFLSYIEGKKCILSSPFNSIDNLLISRSNLKPLQDSFFIL
ncbi:MAG: LytR/AlgR family response regulator transcription factor [Dysgonomonas sp.]